MRHVPAVVLPLEYAPVGKLTLTGSIEGTFPAREIHSPSIVDSMRTCTSSRPGRSRSLVWAVTEVNGRLDQPNLNSRCQLEMLYTKQSTISSGPSTKVIVVQEKECNMTSVGGSNESLRSARTRLSPQGTLPNLLVRSGHETRLYYET